jgi:hypothetical protein
MIVILIQLIIHVFDFIVNLLLFTLLLVKVHLYSFYVCDADFFYMNHRPVPRFFVYKFDICNTTF